MNVKKVSILLYAFLLEWMFYFCSGQEVADILRENLVVTGSDLVEYNMMMCFPDSSISSLDTFQHVPGGCMGLIGWSPDSMFVT